MSPPPRQAGFALVMVLLVVAGATILGVTYLSTTSLRLASGANLVASARARYLAESGLQHALYALRNDPGPLMAGQHFGPYHVDGTADTYTFHAAADRWQPSLYTLHATGTSGGISLNASVTVACENRFAELTLAQGPVAYWRCAETWGWWALDQTGAHSGTYRNGVRVNRTGALLGTADTAIECDGVNDYVDTGRWSVSGTGLTLFAWVRCESGIADEAAILSKAAGPDEDDQYWMLGTHRKGGEVRLRLRLRTQGKDRKLDASTGAVKPWEWAFVAGVYDGSKMRLYLNGVEVDTKNEHRPLDVHAGAEVWLGGVPGDPRALPWAGRLDEVAVFDRALGADVIAELYRARLPQVRVIRWND